MGLGRLPQQDHGEGSSVDVKSAGLRSRVRKTFSMSSISEASNASSYAFAHGDTKTNTSVDTTSNLQGLQHNFKTGSVDQIKSLSSAKSEQVSYLTFLCSMPHRELSTLDKHCLFGSGVEFLHCLFGSGIKFLLVVTTCWYCAE